MKKNNFVVAMLLVITLLFSGTQVVVAQNNADFLEWYEYFKTEGKYHIGEANNSARGMCASCGWYTASVCFDDNHLADEGYHKNFFGITTDCYMYGYTSRGADACLSCTQIQEIFDGELACWENHSSCNKGVYDICTMEYS